MIFSNSLSGYPRSNILILGIDMKNLNVSEFLQIIEYSIMEQILTNKDPVQSKVIIKLLNPRGWFSIRMHSKF